MRFINPSLSTRFRPSNARFSSTVSEANLSALYRNDIIENKPISEYKRHDMDKYAKMLQKNGNELNNKRILPHSSPFTTIHPTAIVHPAAVLGENVKIGPYCIVGPDVILENNVELRAHAIVEGRTFVGEGTIVYSYAVIGGESQDKKHQQQNVINTQQTLLIGSQCIIREHVTIHGSSSYTQENSDTFVPTQLGDNCWVLCGAHIGHDCQIGNNVVISNDVAIAGHVEIHDYAIIGGQAAIQQYSRIGTLAMIGGKSGVHGSVIPFTLVKGNRGALVGLNLVGLRRAKIPRSNITLLMQVYRYLFETNKFNFVKDLSLPKEKLMADRVLQVQNYLNNNDLSTEMYPEVHEMISFTLNNFYRSQSSLCQVGEVEAED